MAKRLFLILNACVCIQLVLGQAKTAWSAANGGIGLGTTSAPDPTDHQIHLALVGINNAATELEAAQAAATIYSPTLDMSDNVKQALENKVRVLRTPPGWTHPIPPPLPFGFDVMTLIMSAYYGTATPASAAAPPAAPQAAAAPQPGPPTAIRRGPAPGTAFAPGGAMPGMGSVSGFTTGPHSMMEPTNWEVELAIHNINAATTEAEAANAAAAVYRVQLDTPDAVVNAFQEKVARLRNPGWTGIGTPPLPNSFRPVSFIARAFRQLQEALQASAASASATANIPAPASVTNLGGAPQPPPSSRSKAGPSPQKVAAPKKKTHPAPPSRAEVELQLRRQEQEQRRTAGERYFNNYQEPVANVNPPRYQTDYPPRKDITRPPRYQLNETPAKPAQPAQRGSNSNSQPMISNKVDRAEPYQSASYPSGVPKAAPSLAPPTRQTDLFLNNNKQEPPKAPVQTEQSSQFSQGLSASSLNNNAQPASIPQQPAFKRPDSFLNNNFPSPSQGSNGANNGRAKINNKLASRYPGLDEFQQQAAPRMAVPAPAEKPLEGNSLIRAPVPTFKPPEKRPISSPPERSSLNERYPGLVSKNRQNTRNQQLEYLERNQQNIAIPNPNEETFSEPKSPIGVPRPPISEVVKPKPAKPSSFKRSQQIWSPMGSLGLGIDNILKTSIIDGAESIPIPTQSTPPPPTTTSAPTTTTTTTMAPTTTTTTTTTTSAPTTTTIRAPETPKAKLDPPAVSKSKPPPPTDAAATKASTQLSSQDKLKELENLLRGISPGELESLVNIIKTKAGPTTQDQGPPPQSREAPPPPIYDQLTRNMGTPPQSRDPPPQQYDQAPYDQDPRGPPPGYIPPPPGSQNNGPPREMRRGPGPQNNGAQRGPPPPGWRGGQNGPPMGDGQGGPDNMPPWARNGNNMNGPPMGGQMGGPMGGQMGGPPGMGRGGPGGPGGLDPNNPQIARLIRVITKRMPDILSSRTGGARNPVSGEAPEQPEGGAMNPMMMAMLMNQGGGGGGGDLGALLGLGGGSGGGNPLASLLGGGGGMGGLGALGALGGGGGGGGSQLDLLTAALAGPNAPLAPTTPEAAQAAGNQAMAMQLLSQMMGGQGQQGEGPTANSGLTGNPMAMLQALQGGAGGGGATSEMGNLGLLSMLGGGGGGGGGMGSFGAFNLMSGLGFGAV